MMGLLEAIEQYATLWNADKNDGAAFFVDFVLKSYDEVVACAPRLNQPIQNKNDLFYHFFKTSLTNAVSRLANLNISGEDRNKLISLDSSLEKDIKGFCNYINAHSKSLFRGIKERKGEAYFFGVRCLKDALGLYSNSLSGTTIEEILSVCAFNILADFDRYAGYFKKHRDCFSRLFDGIDGVEFFDSVIYVSFLTKYHGSKDLESRTKEYAKTLCDRFLPSFRERAHDSDDPLILQNKFMFDSYYSLARHYRLPCANEFRSLEGIYEATIEEYSRKHGQKAQVEQVSLKPALDMLKRESSPYKFIELTIHFDSKENKHIFFYDCVFGISHSAHPLLDSVNRIDMPSSAKYPYHIQDALWMDQRIQTGLMNSILKDEKLSREFIHYLPTIANDIDHELLGGKGDIAFEVAGSIEMLTSIISIYKAEKYERPLYKALTNGLCENLLNTLEKTLRLLTLEESYSTEYFEEKDLTLGQMLSHGRPQLLSRSLIRLLQFHLDADKDLGLESKRPGRNLRNIHMHNLGGKYKNTNYGDCLWLVYILMTVFNELELRAIERRSKKGIQS